MTAPGALPAWLRPLAEAGAEADLRGLPRAPRDGSGRSSAVLVLFGEGPSGPDVLLIERAATLNSHAGQPAFPGGTIDPGDDGPVGAALREAEEETGLDPPGVDVLAVLPELFVSRTRFRVTPVLAWWREPCAVGPVDPGEVAAVARVPLAELADPENRLWVRHPTNPRNGYRSVAFSVRGMVVWGFTAGLLDKLLQLTGFARPWNTERVEALPSAKAGLIDREIDRERQARGG
ncbi:MAG: NUDIX domain-containing protein [Streptosporangiales bacterium]|nr:NUDIX domain-containing protein [Streptosporangiales bacterium]